MHPDEYEDVPGESFDQSSNGFDYAVALSFAYMGQSGSLRVTGSPGIIPLDDPAVLSDDLWYEDGVLSLSEPGIYLAAFALAVPFELSGKAEIRLFLNGRDLPGVIYHIVEPLFGGSGVNLSAQGAFEIQKQSTFCVLSREALRFQTASPETLIASLAMIRIR